MNLLGWWRGQMTGSDETKKMVSAALAGDVAAFDRLALAHYESVHRYLQMQLKNPSVVEANDVLQEAFATAFGSLEQFRGSSKEDFEAWLRGIARNRMVDLLRKAKRKKRGGDFRRVQPKGTESQYFDLAMMLVDESESPSRVVAADEAALAVQEAIGRLPTQQGIALRLRFIDGLSLEEVAEATELSVPAIRGLIFRAKKALRQDMGTTTRWFGQG